MLVVQVLYKGETLQRQKPYQQAAIQFRLQFVE